MLLGLCFAHHQVHHTQLCICCLTHLSSPYLPFGSLQVIIGLFQFPDIFLQLIFNGFRLSQIILQGWDLPVAFWMLHFKLLLQDRMEARSVTEAFDKPCLHPVQQMWAVTHALCPLSVEDIWWLQALNISSSPSSHLSNNILSSFLEKVKLVKPATYPRSKGWSCPDLPASTSQVHELPRPVMQCWGLNPGLHVC